MSNGVLLRFLWLVCHRKQDLLPPEGYRWVAHRSAYSAVGLPLDAALAIKGTDVDMGRYRDYTKEVKNKRRVIDVW